MIREVIYPDDGQRKTVNRFAFFPLIVNAKSGNKKYRIWLVKYKSVYTFHKKFETVDGYFFDTWMHDYNYIP